VAESPTALEKIGLTRGKAVLVGALAFVLLGVLYWQFAGSTTASSSDPVGYTPPRRVAVPRPPAAKPAPATAVAGERRRVAMAIDPAKWKSPELSSVVDYDPFALPEAFPQPVITAVGNDGDSLVAAATADTAQQLAEEVERLRTQLQELKERGVQVIVRERDQYAAVIGDRMLHVGDEINGFTVTGIDPSGVHVERKEAP
jgi:hypothetical protein